MTDSTVESSISAVSFAEKPEDVTQHEDGDLPRRQHLQGGHESQSHRLGLLVAGLRPEGYVEPARDQGVGERLEPGHLAEPGRLAAARRRARPTRAPGAGRGSVVR